MAAQARPGSARPATSARPPARAACEPAIAPHHALGSGGVRMAYIVVAVAGVAAHKAAAARRAGRIWGAAAGGAASSRRSRFVAVRLYRARIFAD